MSWCTSHYFFAYTSFFRNYIDGLFKGFVLFFSSSHRTREGQLVVFYFLHFGRMYTFFFFFVLFLILLKCMSDDDRSHTWNLYNSFYCYYYYYELLSNYDIKIKHNNNDNNFNIKWCVALSFGWVVAYFYVHMCVCVCGFNPILDIHICVLIKYLNYFYNKMCCFWAVRIK